MNQKSLLNIVLLTVALVATSTASRAESAFDAAPTPIRTAAPVYPEGLRRGGVSGMVSIKATVDENGNVTGTVVAKSSNPEFEEPALAAVAQWKFTPAMKAGQAVVAVVMLPVRFVATQ